jgi:hypothetical protein
MGAGTIIRRPPDRRIHWSLRCRRLMRQLFRVPGKTPPSRIHNRMHRTTRCVARSVRPDIPTRSAPAAIRCIAGNCSFYKSPAACAPCRCADCWCAKCWCAKCCCAKSWVLAPEPPLCPRPRLGALCGIHKTNPRTTPNSVKKFLRNRIQLRALGGSIPQCSMSAISIGCERGEKHLSIGGFKSTSRSADLSERIVADSAVRLRFN